MEQTLANPKPARHHRLRQVGILALVLALGLGLGWLAERATFPWNHEDTVMAMAKAKFGGGTLYFGPEAQVWEVGGRTVMLWEVVGSVERGNKLYIHFESWATKPTSPSGRVAVTKVTFDGNPARSTGGGWGSGRVWEQIEVVDIPDDAPTFTTLGVDVELVSDAPASGSQGASTEVATHHFEVKNLSLHD